MPQGQSLVGSLSVVICLRNNLAKTQCGIALPLAPVSTLHLRLPHWFGPISAGMVTVPQGSVSASILITVMLMCSGSLGAGEHMLIGGTIVAEWGFWATQGDNALDLAWSSPGSQPSWTEWCGWTSIVMTQTSSHGGHSCHLHQQCGFAFIFHLWALVWLTFCLDLSLYWRCFAIGCPSDQFCHMTGMWSPWQGRRLCQVHGT